MASSSQVERQSRQSSAAVERTPVGERMRRLLRRARRVPRSSPRVRRLAGRLAPIRRAAERVLRTGVGGTQAVDIQKRIRLCNIFALSGGVIMATWTLVEVLLGEHGNLAFELP